MEQVITFMHNSVVEVLIQTMLDMVPKMNERMNN